MYRRNSSGDWEVVPEGDRFFLEGEECKVDLSDMLPDTGGWIVIFVMDEKECFDAGSFWECNDI